jgi:hypothetical protein
VNNLGADLLQHNAALALTRRVEAYHVAVEPVVFD